MAKYVLIFFGLLVGYAFIASAVAEKPTTSRARAATPTVTPSPTQEPTATVAPAATIPAGPTATPVASPTPQSPETIYEVYTVQRGDTLNRIAAHFSKDEGHSVTVEAIVTANGITDPARIEVGEQFMIPVTVGDYVPTPTPAPTVEPIPVSGLGVSRREIKSVYQHADVGFTFEDASLASGIPRSMGRSPDSTAILDLIGPRGNLTQVTLVVGLPNDAPKVVLKNMIYLIALPHHVLPGWAGASDWLEESITIVMAGGEQQTTYFGKAEISLLFLRELGMLSLSIETK